MTRRLALCAPLALAAALALAGCASNTSGSPAAHSGSSSPSSTASSSPSPSASSSDGPITVSQFVALVQHGVEATSSARFTQHTVTAGVSSTGTGAEKLHDGTLVAADITEQIPSLGSLGLRLVDGKAYLMLPTKLRHGGKAWSLVTTHSSNPVVAAVAKTALPALQSTSITTTAKYLDAAKSVIRTGTTTSSAGTLTTYRVLLDPSKLAAASPFGKAAAAALGSTPLPFVVELDSQGRTVRSTTSFTVSGHSVSVVFTASDFNQPVTITAPPASQTSD